MKALLLRHDVEAAAGDAQALIDKGFQVVCVETRNVAHALMRIETVDLLVMEERIGGRLTHALALSAERHNPYISTVLMTDRPGSETDELYELIPSLYALVGTDTAPRLLGQLALSSVENYDEIEARVRRNIEIDAAEAADDSPPLDADPWDNDEAPDAVHATDQDVQQVEDDVVDDATGIATQDEQGAQDKEVPETDIVWDIPSYADAVSATPELAEPEYDPSLASFDDDDHDYELGDAQPDTPEDPASSPAAHLAQVSVIGEMRAARASFR